MMHKKLGYYIPGRKGAKSKTLTLNPGCGKAVSLGKYDIKSPLPNIKLSCHPELGDEMSVAHEKLQLPGESTYELLYKFHNYSSRACEIKIQFI